MIYTDQLMREVSLSKPASRIVSLVPSQTELLYDLGLENEIAAITKFCIHPEIIFKTKERIGGTKNINLAKIKSINPDLIIANKEENLSSDIKSLEKEFPVWVSDIHNLDDALDMISKIGTITDRQQQAGKITGQINQNFSNINSINGIRTLYLIWKDPFMAAGCDTFINDMMRRCGMTNVLAHKNRYPEITADEIKAMQPELILLSSEPFPFKNSHIAEIKKIIPNADCITVDGEYFSWYGSRLIKSPEYFNTLIRPTDIVNRI